MESVFNIEKVKSLIPHRYPFLLVDKVLEITEANIKALKNVTINEPFFQGHFPGSPVMPGVLIVEALAQAAGVLMGNAIERSGASMEDKLMFFMSIDNVKFRQVVVPGDQVHLQVELTQKRASIAKFAGKALVDGKVVTEANFMAMISDRA